VVARILSGAAECHFYFARRVTFQSFKLAPTADLTAIPDLKSARIPKP